MSDENGTLLARQLRRFIEENPAAKSLENVEESAKTIILGLGNPEYYQDESERFEPFPPELRLKKSFESRYKKLQGEYTSLPDLKKKVSEEGEKEEREKKAKEELEKQEKEEREKKEKEEREKEEKEEREKKEKEEREKEEKEEREKKEKEEREKKEKEEREKKEKEDREKQDREKQETQQMGRESNIDHLLDQLKSMDPEKLQLLFQDLEISSGRGSRETTADTASSWNTRGSSGRGSRETTADTASSWNTRGSSVDPTSSASGYWRKVREAFGEDTGYWLNKLSVTSQENDCDFADVKFYLEYLLRQDSDRSVSDLAGLAFEFIDECPVSQAVFVKNLREKDPQLSRARNTYHASSRISSERKERRPWARNPQAYRDRILEGLPPEKNEEWDQITLSIDPDTRKKNVKGRITASIGGYLDVCLDSLLDKGEERHHLVPKADYSTEAERFEGSERGKKLSLNRKGKETFKNREKSDFKILNYTSADQIYASDYPRMYFVGIDKKDKKTIVAWVRSAYCFHNKFKGGFDDLNEQRKACGQRAITKVSRPHIRLPIGNGDPNSDSDSAFESDIESVSAV